MAEDKLSPDLAESHLKEDALAVVEAVDKNKLERSLKDTDESASLASKAVSALLNILSNADVGAAQKRVSQLKQKNKDKTADEITELIIKQKVQQTAAIGAASSSAGLIPGLGTLTSLTVGVATDITATFKLQAEMVLEIASAYNFTMSDLDQQKLIYLVTGVSTGGNILMGKVGKEVSVKLTERYAQKWLSNALPFIGIAASSSTNALSTYLIAERAKAYFKDGPDAVTDWRDSLRRVSGVDERKIGNWVSESSNKTWQAVTDVTQATTDALSTASQATGQAVATGVSKTVKSVKDLSSSAVDSTVSVFSKAGSVLHQPFKRKNTGQVEASEEENEDIST